MLQPWKREDNNGRQRQGQYQYPEGELVTQKTGIVVTHLWQDDNNEYFHEVDGKLQSCGRQNPFNGYVYRQDGE